jgi:hypothetical protein
MEVAFALFFVTFLVVVLAVDIFSALIAGIKAAAASESSAERRVRATEDKERLIFVLSI